MLCCFVSVQIISFDASQVLLLTTVAFLLFAIHISFSTVGVPLILLQLTQLVVVVLFILLSRATTAAAAIESCLEFIIFDLSL